MQQIRFLPGLILLLALVLVPLGVVVAYQVWVARSGPVLGELDGILIVVGACALLFAVGRACRRFLWREPMTDVQLLVPIVMYAAVSFDRIMANPAPVAMVLFQLLYALSIWLGARGACSAQPTAPVQSGS